MKCVKINKNPGEISLCMLGYGSRGIIDGKGDIYFPAKELPYVDIVNSLARYRELEGLNGLKLFIIPDRGIKYLPYLEQFIPVVYTEKEKIELAVEISDEISSLTGGVQNRAIQLIQIYEKKARRKNLLINFSLV